MGHLDVDYSDLTCASLSLNKQKFLQNFTKNTFFIAGVLCGRSQPAQGLPLGRGRGIVLHEERRYGPQDSGSWKIQGCQNQGRRCELLARSEYNLANFCHAKVSEVYTFGRWHITNLFRIM